MVGHSGFDVDWEYQEHACKDSADGLDSRVVARDILYDCGRAGWQSIKGNADLAELLDFCKREWRYKADSAEEKWRAQTIGGIDFSEFVEGLIRAGKVKHNVMLTSLESFILGVSRGEHLYADELMLPTSERFASALDLLDALNVLQDRLKLLDCNPFLSEDKVRDMIARQELGFEYDMGVDFGRLWGMCRYVFASASRPEDTARRVYAIWEHFHRITSNAKFEGSLLVKVQSCFWSTLALGLGSDYENFEAAKADILDSIQDKERNSGLARELECAAVLAVGAVSGIFASQSRSSGLPLASASLDASVSERLDRFPDVKSRLSEAENTLKNGNFIGTVGVLGPLVEKIVGMRFKRSGVGGGKTPDWFEMVKLLSHSKNAEDREFAEVADLIRRRRNQDQHQMRSWSKSEATFLFHATCLLTNMAVS